MCGRKYTMHPIFWVSQITKLEKKSEAENAMSHDRKLNYFRSKTDHDDTSKDKREDSSVTIAVSTPSFSTLLIFSIFLISYSSKYDRYVAFPKEMRFDKKLEAQSKVILRTFFFYFLLFLYVIEYRSNYTYNTNNRLL